jgi:hypothetical protein
MTTARPRDTSVPQPSDPPAPAQQTVPTLAVCSQCVHYRMRSPVGLFGPSDMRSAGVLKEQSTWEQEERQRALQEQHAFVAGQPFVYEPHHYAWCAKYSRADEVEVAQVAARGGDHTAMDDLLSEGVVALDPVTGDYLALYVLCAWKNTEGRCEHYAQRTARRG